MKKDNLEQILSKIDEKTLGAVLDEREKKLKKLAMKMKKLKEPGSSFEEIIIEETKKEKIKRIILKVLSVAAAAAVIAGIIYVVRFPFYMNGKRPDPAGADTAKVPVSDTAAEDTRQEAVVQEYELTDVSQIRPGMTCEEVENTLPELTYSTGLLSKRGIKYYVNDKETGRVFFVYCEDGVVTDVRDSGKAVGYAAPGSYLSKLHDGMSFDDVVSILGSPVVYYPLTETLFNEMMIRVFRVEDRANITLSFTEKPDGADGTSEIVLENLERYLYRYGKDELLLGYYDVYRTDMVSEKDAAGIITGMTFGKVYSMIGSPISREDYGGDTVTPCWRLGPNKWLAVRFVPVTYTVTDPASELIVDRVEIQEMDKSYPYPDPKDRNFKAADHFDKNDLKTWFDPDNSAGFDMNNLKKIKKGMTFEEIVGILGRPVRGSCPTPNTKCIMQWEYDGGYTTVVIGFKQTDSFFPTFDMVIDYYLLIDSNNEDPDSRMVTKHF